MSNHNQLVGSTLNPRSFCGKNFLKEEKKITHISTTDISLHENFLNKCFYFEHTFVYQ